MPNSPTLRCILCALHFHTSSHGGLQWRHGGTLDEHMNVCRAQRLRMYDQSETLRSAMTTSFNKFSKFVTELKLDHGDGKVSSERLDQSLAYILTSPK